jgi:hypothetical protein
MSNPSGGLKGLLQTTGKTIFSAGVIVRDYGTIAARWGYKIGGNLAFVMATTSMIVLMPLIFESTREVQVCSSDFLFIGSFCIFILIKLLNVTDVGK